MTILPPNPNSVVGTHLGSILLLLSFFSRRRFLGSAGAATVFLVRADTQAESASEHNENLGLIVDGRLHALDLDRRTTLLDALREHLGLTGTKKGCDQGRSGGCVVIVDGQRIDSCMTLAAMLAGDEITTIEDLAFVPPKLRANK
jgi:xanthine dehydrogenase YagT iron-sulfur-binding subunit